MVSQQPHMRVIAHIAHTHTKRPLNSRVTADHRHIHTIVVITVTTDVHEIVNAASVNTHIRLRVTNHRPTELIVREHHRLTLVADGLHHVLHEHAVTIPTTRSVNRETRTVPALGERKRFCFPTETSRLARNQSLSTACASRFVPKCGVSAPNGHFPAPALHLPGFFSSFTCHFTATRKPPHHHKKTSQRARWWKIPPQDTREHPTPPQYPPENTPHAGEHARGRRTGTPVRGQQKTPRRTARGLRSSRNGIVNTQSRYPRSHLRLHP